MKRTVFRHAYKLLYSSDVKPNRKNLLGKKEKNEIATCKMKLLRMNVFSAPKLFASMPSILEVKTLRRRDISSVVLIRSSAVALHTEKITTSYPRLTKRHALHQEYHRYGIAFLSGKRLSKTHLNTQNLCFAIFGCIPRHCLS